ncbi:VMAP-C domain-containing protein [Streptomyces sp. NPDC054949]
MSRLDFRHTVLEEMSQDKRSAGINADVCESGEPRAHLWGILHTIGSRPDPHRALESLCDALRAHAPWDRELQWLELTVLALGWPMPLPTEEFLQVIEILRGLSAQPRPAQLPRYLPSGSRPSLLTGEDTLPEIMVRLADRRGDQEADGLLRFLRAFSTHADPPLHGELAPLRILLDRLNIPRTLPRAALDTCAHDAGAAPHDSRLIVQVRLEAEDAEHVDDGRYRLQAAYYRQPRPSGPIQLIGTLGRTESFHKSELIGAGSARLADWSELARAVRGAARDTVRVEFLLPRSLLGHAAELWSAGASHRPLGHHHPVVVRSLERYTDAWLDVGPWHARWSNLQAQGPEADALDRIGWPELDDAGVARLAQWLAEQPTLACMGLEAPYEGLHPDVRAAVDDAIFTDGVPVLLWRRGPGEASELMKVLREHNPSRLAELPTTVLKCRRHGRAGGATDVRNNITLLWDDPDCVDPEQDSPYAGMA